MTHQLGADAAAPKGQLDRKSRLAVAVQRPDPGVEDAQFGSAANDVILEVAIDEGARLEAELGIIAEIVVGDLESEAVVACLRVETDQVFLECAAIGLVEPSDGLGMEYRLNHRFASAQSPDAVSPSPLARTSSASYRGRRSLHQ